LDSKISVLLVVGLHLLGPILVGVAYLLPENPGKRVCNEIEFLVQEASRCAANPLRWDAWSKSKKAYGLSEGEGLADASNCEGYIERATGIGMSYEQLEVTGSWLRDGNVRGLWDDILEYEFCKYADDVGWTQRFKLLEAQK
jgi:hypothetical protein